MHTGVLEYVGEGINITVWHEADPVNGDDTKVVTDFEARAAEVDYC